MAKCKNCGTDTLVGQDLCMQCDLRDITNVYEISDPIDDYSDDNWACGTLDID